MVRDLGIYVHIPFCVSKCIYCDFYSVSTDEDTKNEYAKALKRHIREESALHRERYRVVSVFFGGGTPSTVNAGVLMNVLDTIKECYNIAPDCEITVECNPKTIGLEDFVLYREHGVNRISMGLQSVNDNELKVLGRIHTFADFCKTYEAARKAGLHNINTDIISAIPGQTLEGFKKTLKTVTEFRPEHISVYSLIVEENTPLFEMVQSNSISALPDEDVEREMYYMTGEILAGAGYGQYEISNYSLREKECVHNRLYWQRTEYMGYGAGAASLMADKRFAYEKNVGKYMENYKSCLCDEEILTLQDCMSEYMYLGLRMSKGVSKDDFRLKFSRQMDNVFGSIIDKYVKTGHLTDDGVNVRLTPRGIDVSNYIFSDFLL